MLESSQHWNLFGYDLRRGLHKHPPVSAPNVQHVVFRGHADVRQHAAAECRRLRDVRA